MKCNGTRGLPGEHYRLGGKTRGRSVPRIRLHFEAIARQDLCQQVAPGRRSPDETLHEPVDHQAPPRADGGGVRGEAVHAEELDDRESPADGDAHQGGFTLVVHDRKLLLPGTLD
jgi:hypothetical protein